METKYVSFKLSEKLAKNGCFLESEYLYSSFGELLTEQRPEHHEEYYPCYDILNDICVKYHDEFFGEGINTEDGTYSEVIIWEIITLLEKGRKQEAEDFLWSNCLFNPNNK